MERLQRTRLLSVAVLGMVFVSGLLLGLALDPRLDEAEEPPTAGAEQASSDSGDHEDRGRRVPMYRQVGELTAEQETRIDSIVEIQRESIRELRRDFNEFRESYNARMSDISDGTREAIKEVLTAEQAMRYDSLIAEYRESHRRNQGSQNRKP